MRKRVEPHGTNPWHLPVRPWGGIQSEPTTSGRGATRRVVLSAAILLSGLSLSQTAWAQDPIHKMGRGVVNILTGWIELPKQIHLGSQEENPVVGLGRGLLKGASLTILRGGVGIYETLTFPLPYPKDFASPYEQMELNDYAWE